MKNSELLRLIREKIPHENDLNPFFQIFYKTKWEISYPDRTSLWELKLWLMKLLAEGQGLDFPQVCLEADTGIRQHWYLLDDLEHTYLIYHGWYLTDTAKKIWRTLWLTKLANQLDITENEKITL